jgi:hypothetical protein
MCNLDTPNLARTSDTRLLHVLRQNVRLTEHIHDQREQSNEQRGYDAGKYYIALRAVANE